MSQQLPTPDRRALKAVAVLCVLGVGLLLGLTGPPDGVSLQGDALRRGFVLHASMKRELKHADLADSAKTVGGGYGPDDAVHDETPGGRPTACANPFQKRQLSSAGVAAGNVVARLGPPRSAAPPNAPRPTVVIRTSAETANTAPSPTVTISAADTPNTAPSPTVVIVGGAPTVSQQPPTAPLTAAEEAEVDPSIAHTQPDADTVPPPRPLS
jgi:hypothetical protein